MNTYNTTIDQAKKQEELEAKRAKARQASRRWYLENKERIKESKKEYDKQYALKNKEKIRQNNKRWSLKNKEKVKQHHSQWCLRNKDRVSEYQRKSSAKRKDKIKAYIKEWRAKNKEQDNERRRIYNKEWRKNNKERAAVYAREALKRTCLDPLKKKKIAERVKKYYDDNKELISERAKDSRLANSEQIKQRGKKYYRENREKILTRCREYQSRPEARKKNYQNRIRRLEADPGRKIGVILRARILIALQGIRKTSKTTELLGCSIEQARKHIESLWQPGMSWENHTLHGWHIDHIVPINTFDLTNVEEQKKCFHYTNIRPLWAKDNLSRPLDGSDINPIQL